MTRPPYLQRLKEFGFKIDGDKSYEVLLYFSYGYIEFASVQYSSEHIEATLRTLVDLGVNFYPLGMRKGMTPLQNVFWKATLKLAGVPLPNLDKVVTALLKNGADPYALDQFGYSLFDIAEMSNRTSILLRALERAGYDVDKVQAEIQWRKCCFHNPSHGFAASTAVDSAEIAQPSAKGLVLRKCIRGDRVEGWY
ncbi:MAG: hypothetical protein L6R35_006280 [Caloplaca aegaea]|nr:MAG: hypothetical protein L6R35_006280 [Caloplaca aegaea]